MSATTVPRVRAALVAKVVALLAAAPVDYETQVFYGHPGQEIPQQFVAVAETESGVTREQRTLPLRQASSRGETYDVRLVVWCATGDHDSAAQKVVSERAWALVDRIDDGLRIDTTLGGLVQSALPTSFDDQDFLLNEGRASQVVVLVSVTVSRS